MLSFGVWSLFFNFLKRLFMVDRVNGIVKWFNAAKGYGFIQVEGGEDVFVHYRLIRGDGYRSLNEGQKVEFAIQTGPKGSLAEDVLILE